MKRYTLFFACLLFALSPMFVFAQGSDDASNIPYNDGWHIGDDGGTGFGPWNLTDNSIGGYGHFIGTSILSASIGSESWGMYANSGGQSDAIRDFDTAPAAFDRVSYQMDNGYIDGGGVVGMTLQTNTGAPLMEVYFKNGVGNYIVKNKNDVEIISSIPYTTDGIDVQIYIVSLNEFAVVLEHLGTHQKDTIEGEFMLSQAIGKIRFFNFNAGNNSDHDQFFNNLKHETGIVLPLEWLSFSAEKQDQQVDLSWSYEGSNIERFFVERAGEDRQFSPISEAVLSDLNQRSATMFFTDFNPLDGSNYYRIIALDHNVERTYSPIRKIWIQKKEGLFFYPNPVVDYITIESPEASLSQVNIFDSKGQSLIEKELSEKSINHLDLSSLDNGEYTIVFLYEKGMSKSQRLIKVK